MEWTSTIVLRGAGGFGGAPGPSRAPVAIPDGPPDVVVEQQTQTDQALLYRLSGDRNPLHSDPRFAAEKAGFPRPILHGLCTYGFAGRALLEAVCDDRADRLGTMSARFVAPVFPGEVLTTAVWRRDGGTARFRTEAAGQDGADRRVVLDAGEVELA